MQAQGRGRRSLSPHNNLMKLVELLLLFNGCMISRESDLSKVTVGPRILNPFQVLTLTSPMTLSKPQRGWASVYTPFREYQGRSEWASVSSLVKWEVYCQAFMTPGNPYLTYCKGLSWREIKGITNMEVFLKIKSLDQCKGLLRSLLHSLVQISGKHC